MLSITDILPDHMTPGSSQLLYGLAGGALGVFKLALAAAFLAEIAPLQQFILNRFHRATTPGGVPGPRHVSSMKVAGIGRIGVKLLQWLDSRALPPVPVRLLALPHLAITACADAGKELRCLRVNTSSSRAQPHERPQS
jgi:hypothetical protein